MDDSLQSTSPLGAADQMMGFTVIHLVIIVIFAGLVILGLWWGSRLVRKRREAVEQLEEDNRLERVERGTPVPPPVETTDKRSETPPPPTRPAPPPIAEGETAASPKPAPERQATADAPVPAAPPAPEPQSPEESPAPAAAAPVETEAPSPAPAPAEAPEQPATSASGDSLTTLKGVGPKVAAKLNDLGIRSFADLAALSPEQAAAIDAEMGNFKGRMNRDRWQEQAALLAAGDRAGYEAKFGKLG